MIVMVSGKFHDLEFLIHPELLSLNVTSAFSREHEHLAFGMWNDVVIWPYQGRITVPPSDCWSAPDCSWISKHATWLLAGKTILYVNL
jgi:hypothetical protein